MDTFHAAGRLTTDLNIETTPNDTTLARFRLAVDGHRNHTNFIPCVIFGTYAQTIATHASKGRLIEVSGELHHNTWETDDGDKRERLEVIARNVRFLDAKPKTTHSTDDVDAETRPF